MANYSYEEAIENRYLRSIKPQFQLNADISNEAILIRLLSGTLRITNLLSTDSFDQFNNYSILGRPTNSIVSTRPIRECIEPGTNFGKLCKYLDVTKGVNNQFFLDLLEEVTSYFYKKAKYSHTTCFLHLYRTLEYISYSFPLIYASISREYYGSFNMIKGYFDGAKSELTFFSGFVVKLLEASSLDTSVTFNFATFSEEVNKNHFQIIKQLLPDGGIQSEVRDTSITTTYRHLIKLTIDLRNRYFHFAIGGHRNIRPTEIVESDVFFQIVNEEVLNWISIIYFEILQSAIDKG